MKTVPRNSSNRWRPLWEIAAWMCACLSLRAAPADNPAQHVLIVANRNVPISVQIARYYAERRGVPKEQIFLLDCTANQVVSREEYTTKIETPIREFLEQRGWLRREPVISKDGGSRVGLVTVFNKIRYMTLCFGVPVKIDPDPKWIEKDMQRWPDQFRRNEAAVDSELALLPIEYPKVGFVPNPLYDAPDPTFREPMNLRMILVTRLDGTTGEHAMALIDRAIEGERFGLLGRAYFDGRGIQSGGYALGDTWIRKAYELTRAAGFECVYDDNPAIFDAGYPVTDCVLYAGWYTGSIAGPFARPGFRFRPGAFAYHLHSDSAGSMRSDTTCWTAPLITHGATCSMGCTFEPYLQGSPNIAIFFERFLHGYNFAESAYASQQMLSWQTTFVGDPLYRPFRIGLDEQIEALEKAGSPDVVFAYLRRINLLLNDHKPDEALRYANEQNERLKSPVLAEKIGDMIAAGDTVGAIQRYKDALKETHDDWQAIRLYSKLADAYQKIDKDGLALQSLESILDRWPNYEGKISLYLKLVPLAYKVGPISKANAWREDALRLNPSFTNNPSMK